MYVDINKGGILRKIRVALGSNDGENINPTHMGESKDFYVYSIFEDGKTEFVEKRKNTSPDEEGEHGFKKKRKAVLKLLSDAEIFVGKKMSPNFVKIACNTKCQPVVIKIDSISEILKAITKSFDPLYKLVDQRRQSKFNQKIPKIKGVGKPLEM
jgi:hypothetical protein